MKLYVVRHGVAEEAGGGRRDAERALTAEGRERMERAARGLREIEVELDLVLTSPLRRARETAEIVAAELRNVDVETLDELAPGTDPARVVAALRPWRDRAALALVGHQPDLGALASFLLSGSPDTCPLPFRKGSVACFECELAPRAHRAELEWFLTPKHLRALAR